MSNFMSSINSLKISKYKAKHLLSGDLLLCTFYFSDVTDGTVRREIEQYVYYSGSEYLVQTNGLVSRP
jgi:hypothetical protein